MGEVGEWQCEVRWGARRVVARRAQGAVGKVSRGEWGISKHLEFEEKEKKRKLEEFEGVQATLVSICTEYKPKTRNATHGVAIKTASKKSF